MKTYVINLARSSDRRAHIAVQLAKARLEYELINAVDGRDLDLKDPGVVDPVFAGTSAKRPGVVGCALSHLQIYKKVLDDDIERACVLEDDVVLPLDLGALTDALAPFMRGAEVILLNFHSRESCRNATVRINDADAIKLPSSRLLVQPVDDGQVASAGGYLITREACARMLRSGRRVKAVADDWSFFREQGAIDHVRCVVPMPVIQSPALRTTMSYYRSGSVYAKVREAIAGSEAPILHQALAARRRRHLQRYAIGRTEVVEDIGKVAQNLGKVVDPVVGPN